MVEKKKKSAVEGWKECFIQVMRNQAQPMHQITYWTIFLACSLIFAIGVFMSAVSGSYELINQYPELAMSSWLSKGFLVF